MFSQNRQKYLKAQQNKKQKSPNQSLDIQQQPKNIFALIRNIQHQEEHEMIEEDYKSKLSKQRSNHSYHSRNRDRSMHSSKEEPEIIEKNYYLPLAQKNHLRAMQKLSEIEEKKQERLQNIQLSNKKIKELQQHKPLYQRMEEGYIQSKKFNLDVEIPLLQEKKKRLADIRELHKPIPINHLKEHSKQHRSQLQILQHDSPNKVIIFIKHPIQQQSINYYQSQFYRDAKENQKRYGEAQENHSPNADLIQKKYEYAQQVKKNFIPHIDSKKQKELQGNILILDLQDKLHHRSIMSDNQNISNKKLNIFNLKNSPIQENVNQISQKQNLSYQNGVSNLKFLSQFNSMNKKAHSENDQIPNQVLPEKSISDINVKSHQEKKNQQTNKPVDWLKEQRQKTHKTDEEVFQQKMDKILNDQKLNLFDKQEQLHILTTKYNEKANRQKLLNKVQRGSSEKLEENNVVLLNLKAKLKMLQN